MSDDGDKCGFSIGIPNWPAALIVFVLIGGCVANKYVDRAYPPIPTVEHESPK